MAWKKEASRPGIMPRCRETDFHIRGMLFATNSMPKKAGEITRLFCYPQTGNEKLSVFGIL